MQRKTEGVVLVDVGKPLRLMSLTLPELKPGQVLVEVAYSGVCHTQLMEVRGLRGLDRFLPHTLGHEGSGIVVETGPGVERLNSGDRVVLSWIKGTGADIPNAAYQCQEMGKVNSGAISTFLRHAVVSENRITRIQNDMPLREAALLGCAIPTGVGMVLNTAKVRPGDEVAVFGVGGIGLSAVQACSLMNATTVIAVDVFDHKLEQARLMGATHVVNASKEDPLAKIREITHGRGVDCSIEAAGKRDTMEKAFAAVRVGGGRCVLAGNLPHGEQILLNPFDLINGKQIVGTWGGESRPEKDIPLYVNLYRHGRLNLTDLITHEYPLEDINAAFQDLEDGKVGRSVIRIEG